MIDLSRLALPEQEQAMKTCYACGQKSEPVEGNYCWLCVATGRKDEIIRRNKYVSTILKERKQRKKT